VTGAGWLAAMIPAEYGGSGLDDEASVIMERSNRSRAMPGLPWPDVPHGHAFAHGSEAQKRTWLPSIAGGAAPPVMRSRALDRSDTTRLTTTAVRQGDRYIISGQKV